MPGSTSCFADRLTAMLGSGATPASRSPAQHLDHAVEHVFADRHDQRGFFGELDEFRRRHRRRARAVPSAPALRSRRRGRRGCRRSAGSALRACRCRAHRAVAPRAGSCRCRCARPGSSTGDVLGRQRDVRRQAGEDAAGAAQQAVDQRAHDRIAAVEAIEELVVFDRQQRGVAARGGGGAARRAVEHAQFADQFARARARRG